MATPELVVYYDLRVNGISKETSDVVLPHGAGPGIFEQKVWESSKISLSSLIIEGTSVFGPFSPKELKQVDCSQCEPVLPHEDIAALCAEKQEANPYFVFFIEAADDSHAERFQPPWQQHRNVEKGVFVLYRGDDGNAEPIGTAFAISTNLLLTACHNVVVKSEDGNADMEVTKLKIAPAIKKTDEGKFAAVTSREVSVYRYCIPVDWAALKLHDGALALRFVIPMATADSDMPPRATLEKLYIYHCPVGLFLEDDDTDQLHVTLKEASVGVINTKTLTYQNGAFPGSSGGPYIFRNKAVALHTESVSTSKTAEDIRAEASAAGRKRRMTTSEVALMVADSCVSSHTSHGSGIMLHVRSGIMRLLNEANQQPDGSSRNTLEHIDRTSN